MHRLVNVLDHPLLVKEVTESYENHKQNRSQITALMAFQEATEAYVICPFEGTNTFAIHAKLITLMAEDMQLAWPIRGEIILK